MENEMILLAAIARIRQDAGDRETDLLRVVEMLLEGEDQAKILGLILEIAVKGKSNLDDWFDWRDIFVNRLVVDGRQVTAWLKHDDETECVMLDL